MVTAAAVFGLDLAWTDTNPSGACALDRQGRIVDERLLGSDDEVIAWISDRLDGRAVVAVDAPLRVPNQTGRRRCEAEVAAVYRSRKAGPHPSNRDLFLARNGRIRGEGLADRLAAFGFGDPWSSSQRVVLEVYPHPALVEAFGLEERLLYKAKKGIGPDGRRSGLRNLARLLELLAEADPPLTGERVVVGDATRGRALKAIEDRLDARVCAWIGAVWAAHGVERVKLFGSSAEGHIAIPAGRAVDASIALEPVVRR